MALLSQGAQHHGVMKLRGKWGCRMFLGLVLQLGTSLGSSFESHRWQERRFQPPSGVCAPSKHTDPLLWVTSCLQGEMLQKGEGTRRADKCYQGAKSESVSATTPMFMENKERRRVREVSCVSEKLPL